MPLGGLRYAKQCVHFRKNHCQCIAGMQGLKDLIVTRTAVTQEGVDELQPKIPNAKIQLLYLGDE